MTKLIIAGATGRMGRMLLETAAADEQVQVTAVLDAPGSPAIGQSARAFGANVDVCVTDQLDERVTGQVLIDFTRPEASLAYLERAAARGLPHVIGTTGFTGEQLERLRLLAARVPVVWSPNFSVGVNVVLRLLEQAARELSGYDIEIVEMHHRHKVDAPSGTALRMGEVIAAAQGTRLEDRAIWSRHGHTGARPAGAIGFATLRGGDVVGDHTVIFAAAGERIEIAHKSASRAAYAAGAIRAAKWVLGRPPGLYDMRDVLAG
ncbi:MAG: 4-hydroxy-tetrahydrodipicolinate reductase [Casimicrobiaceae bacterium]|nr:4-hydroxy-tetrahydrodipicolinate reductase [Casimicrobiaceae bacterium]MDW8313188.1 4-hydroxy-tetrahydrodipicolinate reductase [Burkholderiales bacterium]